MSSWPWKEGLTSPSWECLKSRLWLDDVGVEISLNSTTACLKKIIINIGIRCSLLSEDMVQKYTYVANKFSDLGLEGKQPLREQSGVAIWLWTCLDGVRELVFWSHLNSFCQGTADNPKLSQIDPSRMGHPEFLVRRRENLTLGGTFERSGSWILGISRSWTSRLHVYQNAMNIRANNIHMAPRKLNMSYLFRKTIPIGTKNVI